MTNSIKYVFSLFLFQISRTRCLCISCQTQSEWKLKKWQALVICGSNGSHAVFISLKVHEDANVISACELIDRWSAILQISFTQVCTSLMNSFQPKSKNSYPILIICYSRSGHIGSNDTELTPHHMNAIQSQMQGKGGYEANSLRIQVVYSHIHSAIKYQALFILNNGFYCFSLQACWTDSGSLNFFFKYSTNIS